MAEGAHKILLVDDDDMVRDLVAATLKGGDYLRVWINRNGNHYLMHFGV